jgi:CheY-like chemotaxis protein
MPGMNGIDLAAVIKARFPAARIALLTANVQSALRRRAAEAGLDFIDKPINQTKISAFVCPTGTSG